MLGDRRGGAARLESPGEARPSLLQASREDPRPVRRRLLAGGLLYSLLEGKGVQKSVAYAFFIGGVVIIIFGAMAGGGARGQINRVHTGRAEPAEMPFGTVLIGAIVFALGLGVLKL